MFNLHCCKHVQTRLVIADHDVGLLLVNVLCPFHSVRDAENLISRLDYVRRETRCLPRGLVTPKT